MAKDQTPPDIRELNRILEEAVLKGAEAVELEYASGGGLEVTFMSGNMGIGYLIKDKKVEEAIMGSLYDNERRQKKAGGTLRLEVQGKEYLFHVKPDDSFGETAYRLVLKKAKR